MIYGPMFRREYRAANRGRRPNLDRAVLACILVLFLVIAASLMHTANQPEPSSRTYGQVGFVVVFVTELFFGLFFVPSFVAASVAEERQKDTLPMLLLTRLRPIEITLVKLVARWLPALSLLLTGLPFLIGAAFVGGIEKPLLLSIPLLLSTSLMMAALSVLASASREQSATALAQARFWCLGWLIGPPVVTLMPIPTATLWGQILIEVKGLCAYIAPSSPASLATDRSWYYQRADLSDTVAVMIALQALFGLLAVFLTASRLQAREKHPNWTDPTRGYRPPCGDDPIFWREYDLPTRRGGGPILWLRVRLVWILIRATLLTILALVVAVLVISVPVGMIYATLYYGFPAFREAWQYGQGDPYTARMHFNFVVRAATLILALVPILSLSSVTLGKIKAERDKKTWDTLLTTPLTGEEIIASKSRAALYGFRQIAWTLLIIWGLGILCGSVSPLGMAIAGIDLIIVAWLNVALGFSMALRPIPEAKATSWTSSITLIVFFGQLPILGFLTASRPELVALSTLGWWIWWGIMLAILAVMISMALLARRWTRLTREKFEEWAGRPMASKPISSFGLENRRT